MPTDGKKNGCFVKELEGGVKLLAVPALKVGERELLRGEGELRSVVKSHS